MKKVLIFLLSINTLFGVPLYIDNNTRTVVSPRHPLTVEDYGVTNGELLDAQTTVKYIWISAKDLTSLSGPVFSNFSYTPDTAGVGLIFDAATEEASFWTGVLPWDVQGDIKVKFFWRSTTVASGDVIWGIQGYAVTDGESIDGGVDVAMGTAVTVTDASLNSDVTDLQITPATANVTITGSPFLGKLVSLRIYRDADDAADTYGADAFLHGILIEYIPTGTAPTAW